MTNPPPETCLSRKTPFQYCMIIILCVTVPFFFIMVFIHLIYLTTNLGASEKCANLCNMLLILKNKSRFAPSELGKHYCFRKVATSPPDPELLMEYAFRNLFDLKERRAKVKELIKDDPSYVAVYVDKDPGSPLEETDVELWKIPRSMSVRSLRLKIEEEIEAKDIFLYVDDERVFENEKIGRLYDKYHENDDVLYVAYSDIPNTLFDNRNATTGAADVVRGIIKYKYKEKASFKVRINEALRNLYEHNNSAPIILQRDPLATSLPETNPTEILSIPLSDTLNQLYDKMVSKVNSAKLYLFVGKNEIPRLDNDIVYNVYVRTVDVDNILYLTYTDNPSSPFMNKKDLEAYLKKPTTAAPSVHPFKFESKLITFTQRKEKPYHDRYQDGLTYMANGTKHVTVYFEKDPKFDHDPLPQNIYFLEGEVPISIELHKFIETELKVDKIALYCNDKLIPRTNQKLFLFFLEHHNDDNWLYIMYTDKDDYVVK